MLNSELGFINNHVEEQVSDILKKSKTYEDAITEHKKRSLSFRYGDVGVQIDGLVKQKIINHALKQKIKL